MAQAFRTQNLRLLASILDANDNELIKSPSLVTSAVNELTISNAATTVSPSISATGDDTNVSLNLISKGTGNILINGKAISLANSFTTAGNFSLSFTTTGNTSLTLPTSGTLATTSQIPTVYDNTLTLAGSGGVSVSATPTFTANASADKTITITIADAALTLGKLANIGGSTILGNSSPSSAGAPAALSVATVASMLSNQTMNIVGTATSVTDIVLVAKGGTGVATAAINTIFAGPSSGSAAAPSFRAMVTADIPTGIVTYAKIQYVANTARVLGRISSLSGEIEELTGANIVTVIDTNAVARATNLAGGIAGQIPYQSAANTTAFSAAGTASQVLLSGAAGAPTWASQSSLSVGSATTAGSVTNALTISSPLTGTSYNGSAAISIGLPNASDTVVGAVSIGAQTFGGNKTFKDAVIISGDLTVNGTTITINSSTLSVDDKNIELGAVIAIASLSSTSNITAASNIVDVTSTSGLIVGQALTKTTGTGAFGTNPVIASIVSSTQFTVSPVHVTTGSIVFSVSGATDITADTGGITLKGASDKTFNWLNATSSWTSSENLDIVTGKTYKINNVAVLSSTTLGSSVVNSSLTSVGTLVNLTVTNAINGSVTGSAASLSTSHTFWGQTFNGTQDVSGNLTSVGNITGSSGLTITAGGSNQNVVLTPSGTGYTLLNGKVGIGTASPTAKLEVVNTGRILGVLRLHITPQTTFYDHTFAIDTDGGGANGFIYTSGTGGTFPLDTYGELILQAGPRTGFNNGISLVTGTTSPSVKLRIAEGGNVGIGTNAPDASLEIYAVPATSTTLRKMLIINTDFASASGAGFGGSIVFKGRTAGNELQDNAQISAYNEDTGDNGYALGFYTRPTVAAGLLQRMTILRGGNVGIGTTVPAYKLDVVGDIHASSEMYLDNGYYLRFKRSSGGVSIQTLGIPSGTDDVQLLTSGDFNILNGSLTNLMTVKNGGNVGIGTTSVGSPLEVYGTSMDPSLTPSATSIFNVNSLGVELAIGRMVTSPHSIWLQGKHATVGGDLTYPIVLNPLGGFVGIGTPSPNAKLEIAGFSTGAGLKLNYGNSSGTIEAVNFIANGAANGVIGMQMVSAGVGDLWLGGSGGRTLTLYRDGNVGIGTNTPAYKLDVSGDLRISGSSPTVGTFKSSASSCFISLIDSSNDNVFLGNDDGDFLIQTPTASYSTKLIVKDDGNVGIGTSSPIVKLQVVGANETSFASAYTGNPALIALYGTDAYNSGTAGGGVFFGGKFNSSDNTTVFATISGIKENSTDTNFAGALTFMTRTNGSGATVAERMRISSDGNVGIGTTSPSQLLHVYKGNNGGLGGAIMIDNNGLAVANETALMFGDGGASYIRAAISSTTENTPYYGDLKFKTGLSVYSSLTTRMIIKGDGNVGIGTTTPAYKLEVASGTSGQQSLVNFRTADSTAANNAGIQIFATPSATATSRSVAVVWDADGANSAGVDYFVLNKVGNSGEVQLQQYSNAAMRFGTNFGGRATYDMTIGTTGNVGIGTVTPIAKLHINSTTAGETVLRTDGTNGTLFSVVDDLSDSLMSVNNSAGLPVLEVFADDRIVAGQYGQNDFVVINNKVGLGANSPINKLSVIGSASIGDSTYNVSAPTNGLIIQGSVGIGTNAPTEKLDVRGGAIANGNGTIKTVLSYTTEGLVGTLSNHALLLFTNNTEKWKITSTGILQSNGAQTIQTSIDNLTLATLAGDGHIVLSPHGNGNVGVGTATPAVKLDVNGSVYATNIRTTTQISATKGTIQSFVTPGVYSNGSSTGNAIHIQSNTSFANQGVWVNLGLHQTTANANDLAAKVYLSVGGWYQNSGTGVPVYIGGGYTSNSSSVLSVVPSDTAGNGSVGIRITSPAATLDVNGTTFLRGNIDAGRTASLNATTAVNGTGGGNREFVTFTGASATGFTGTDNADQGYGYFAATIVSGKSYEVSATMVVTNGATLDWVTSTVLSSPSVPVQSIISSPVSNTIYRFVATANAAFVGLGFSWTSGTMTAVVSNFSIKEVSILVTSNSNVGIVTTSPTDTLDVNGTARIRSISASGSAATIFLSTGATGVLVSRTAAEVRSDIVAAAINQTFFIGTTSIAINRASGASFALTGISSIDGTAAALASMAITQFTGTLAVANGGTGVATAAVNTIFAGPSSGSTAAAPSFRAMVSADIPSSITLTTPVIGNIKMGYTTTATAAGTTTLTASSNHYQRFTGSTTQTITLPVTSTLVAGMSYVIENASTGLLTVNSSGGNLVITVIPGVSVNCLCVGITLTTAADWDVEYDEFASITGTGSVVLSISPALVTPALGIPVSGTLTNCDGTAASLTAGNVTTNANLTGPVTSSGNATAITNSAVIFSAIQDVTGPVVIGRLTATAGVVSALTGANIASIIDASAVTNSTNAANVAIATDDTTNSSYYLYFGANITGNTALKASTKIRYNPNTGAFSATTKSFRIPHPTKPQHDLVYGSLESPYHGVRLTGKGKTKGNRAEIFLPDYVKFLIDEETANIQLTVIKCAKILYIENIIINDNKFTVKYDKYWYEKSKDVEFYWDFTAERKDVAKLIVEEKL